MKQYRRRVQRSDLRCQLWQGASPRFIFSVRLSSFWRRVSLSPQSLKFGYLFLLIVDANDSDGFPSSSFSPCISTTCFFTFFRSIENRVSLLTSYGPRHRRSIAFFCCTFRNGLCHIPWIESVLKPHDFFSTVRSFFLKILQLFSFFLPVLSILRRRRRFPPLFPIASRRLFYWSPAILFFSHPV